MLGEGSEMVNTLEDLKKQHLDNYKPVELLRITQALIFLHFQSKELFVKLRELLLR